MSQMSRKNPNGTLQHLMRYWGVETCSKMASSPAMKNIAISTHQRAKSSSRQWKHQLSRRPKSLKDSLVRGKGISKHFTPTACAPLRHISSIPEGCRAPPPNACASAKFQAFSLSRTCQKNSLTPSETMDHIYLRAIYMKQLQVDFHGRLAPILIEQEVYIGVGCTDKHVKALEIESCHVCSYY